MALGFGFDLMSQAIRQRPWTPRFLFGQGEQGAWYDPSDFSTLYQDSAGTTPVTALGQPVGLMLDKSGNGNHASQATPTARPTVQARVNLLERTEEIGTSPWGTQIAGTGVTPVITANAATAPDGTSTADKVEFDVGAGTTANDLTFITQSYTAITGQAATLSFWIRGDVGGEELLWRTSSSNSSPKITVTNQWQRYSVTQTLAGTNQILLGLRQVVSGTINATATVYVWGAQIEYGSTATTYQRVTTATDYADIGLPRYLQFDGIDDAMATASVDFSASDEMTIVAGCTDTVGNAPAFVVGAQDPSGTPVGFFALLANDTTSDRGGVYSSLGTSRSAVSASFGVLNVPSVLSGIINGGSSPYIVARSNGSTVATQTSSIGASNFVSTIPISIGVAFPNGTPQYFHRGPINQIIIRGATTAGALLDATERYVARKTGVSL